MTNLANEAKRFIRSDDGPTVTEYAVMLAAIVLVCVAAIIGIGQFGERTFTTIDNSVPTGSPQ